MNEWNSKMINMIFGTFSMTDASPYSDETGRQREPQRFVHYLLESI